MKSDEQLSRELAGSGLFWTPLRVRESKERIANIITKVYGESFDKSVPAKIDPSKTDAILEAFCSIGKTPLQLWNQRMHELKAEAMVVVRHRIEKEPEPVYVNKLTDLEAAVARLKLDGCWEVIGIYERAELLFDEEDEL
jgi:hypothetical protein